MPNTDTAPAPGSATRVFVVSSSTTPNTEPTARGIEAAYFQTDEVFTTFKDADNKVVFSVRNDLLAHVERADGSDPIVAAFLDLCVAAKERGHANGKVKWETSDTPGGRVYTAGYDITVVSTSERV